MKYQRLAFSALAVIMVAAACSGGNVSPGSAPTMQTPKSVSPAQIKPAPMAHTAILPSSTMTSPRRTLSDIQGLNWTQIPGTATRVAASSDGSIWVLSDQPAGADKYIWHYANSAWTNISGLASQLAVAPNGTLYAVNSGGGTWAYSGGTWTSLGGGAQAITVAADNTIYVLSNGGSGPDRAIWHNVSGSWSQVPGSGVVLGASTDTGSYTLSSGSVNSGGLYILNSGGQIYYENTNGTFASMPGSASAVASTTSGGTFVLGFPANSAGNDIYYYNLSSPGWTSESGAGVSIASNGSTLYVIGSSGAIYSSPITAAATPAPSNIPQMATVGGANAWVASNGFTLYQFTADGNLTSNCTVSTYSGCTGIWPPYQASAGATASGGFTPFTRSDGKVQWAYQGHPLYTYSGDSGPAQTNGDGIREPDGNTWSVSRPAGTTTPTPSPTPRPLPSDTPCTGYYC